MTQRICLALLLVFGVLVQSPPARSAETTPVRASLTIPPSDTLVLGDEISLLWRFHNTGADPLAFMWEGCCRLNGKLQVTKAGQLQPPIPPGSSLAHQFARAERLDPGVAKEFRSLLSDWVQLSESGRYQFLGRYIGVLPTQQPQIPQTLALWRGEATTAVIETDLLNVPDYLAQRDRRAQARGMVLTLAGPETLPPLNPINLTLHIHARSQHTHTVSWPDKAQLWIVNKAGHRLGSQRIDVPSEQLQLAEGTRIERIIPFSTDDLFDAPPGRYTLFIDLAANGKDLPRLPSNPVSIDWNLGPSEVAALVEQAASGHQTGLRNPALKMLRVHLGEIQSTLNAIDWNGLPPPAAQLGRDLALASCLKPMQEVPGRVDLVAALNSGGGVSLASAQLTNCWAEDREFSKPLDRVKRVLDLRRHLGWTIGLVINPEPATEFNRVMGMVLEMHDRQSDLASTPYAKVALVNSTGTNVVMFQPVRTPANLIVRIGKNRSGLTTEIARRLPDPNQPQLAALFKPDDSLQDLFTPLTSAQELERMLHDGQLEFPQTLILVARDLMWSEILGTIRPILERGRPVDMTITK